MSSTSRSLVLSSATNYKAPALLPFLKSLRSTDYQGRMVLIIKDIATEDQEILKRYVDELVDVSDYYREVTQRYGLNKFIWVMKQFDKMPRGGGIMNRLFFRQVIRRFPVKDRYDVWRGLEMAVGGVISLRHSHYQEYLEKLDKQGELPDRVLLTDLRDVVFQGDPFSFPTQEKEIPELEVFLEGVVGNETIGHSAYNTNWITFLKGAKVADRLANCKVACAGTTMGTGEGVLRYARTMNRELSRMYQVLGSSDQGMHNYLLHTGKLKPVTIRPNAHSAVYTMATTSPQNIRFDDQERVLNSDGTVPVVLHQHDRHELLRQWAEQRLAALEVA